MARQLRSAAGGMIYHVLNRANGRDKIFKKQKDFEAFENIVFEAKEKYPIGSWVRKVAKRLGLLSTLRSRGRPKKGT